MQINLTLIEEEKEFRLWMEYKPTKKVRHDPIEDLAEWFANR